MTTIELDSYTGEPIAQPSRRRACARCGVTREARPGSDLCISCRGYVRPSASKPDYTADLPCIDKWDLYDEAGEPDNLNNYAHHARDEAQELCLSCPILEECRSWIMAVEPPGERHGFVAGLTARQRSKLSRQVAA